jgi:hypothetical protein
MRKFKSSVTEGNSPDKEKNYGNSITVPDQSYTVREILTKFASGTLSDVYMEPEFSEDLPDLRGLDITEIHELKKAQKEEVEKLDKKAKKIKEDLENLHRKEAIDKINLKPSE